MLKKIVLSLLVAVTITNYANSQCITVTPTPATYNLPCGVNCTTITVKVPDLRETSDYLLQSIPYTPQPYTTAAPNLAICANNTLDDQFTSVQNIGFPFCFFGQTYTQLVVSTNAILTFDLSNANKANQYTIDHTIPWDGTGSLFNGCGTVPSGVLYPRACIMGPYDDILPRANDPYKIEVRTEGIAPCRRFIASFSEVSMYACTNNKVTSQIILHEATGIIEIFIQSKPICATNVSNGRAILGIQNWDRNVAVSDPAKNNTLWSSTNEGYRFLPSGGNALLQAVQLIRNGAVVATGTIGASANGETTVTFPNYCAATTNDTLEVRALYKNCADASEVITGSATVYVIKNPGDLLATAATTPATCTASDGSITVTVPPGAGSPPFQYSINGGALQSSNTFSGLASGSYTVFVKDASGACTSTINVVVGFQNPLVVTASTTNTTCAGVNNGSITVTPSSGTPPYQYSLNGGPVQGSNVFNGLAAGTYTVTVTDANGCSRTSFITVVNGAGIAANVVPTATTCPGVNNGVITITPLNGSAPYQYQLNAGAFQPGNTFTGLAAGTYSVTVKDFNNCTVTYNNIVITNGAGISATSSTTPASCSGVANGTITVTPTTGTAPYQYQLNAGAFQPGNTFAGLAAGNYTVTVKDFNNCTVILNVTVPSASGVAATATSTATTCAAASNGTITVNVSAGATPFNYALDGGAFQLSNIFTNVTAGAHTVQVRDGNSCTVNVNVNVAVGAGISATAAQTPATCAVATNGTITITPSGGSTPYQYQLDGGAVQPSNIFTNVSSGAHTVLVRDANNCTVNVNVTVTVGAGISATAATTATSCNGASNGSITLTPAGGSTPYQYQLDGGVLQPSNIFSNVTAGPHTVQVRDANNCTVNVNVTVPAGANLTGTTALTHVSCNGGSTGAVTLTPTNGNAPYQFQLNGGPVQGTGTFSSLAAGNYTIQLRDGNNCTGTVSFTITEPTAVTIGATSLPVLCNGQPNGSITITGGGGVTPYQYSINGSAYVGTNIFNVAAGNYTVYVRDANNCVQSTTVTVTQPNALQATATATNATCNGGNDGVITVTANGGNGSYQYSTDGITFQPGNTFNVGPGNFVITVKDANNCTVTANVNVALTNDLVLDTRGDTTICESRSVTLTTASNGLSFAWTPGGSLSDSTIQNPVATPATTTKYVVTATYGRCTAKDSLIVTVNAAPVANAGPGTTICYGKTYQLQGSGGTQFFWRPASLLSNDRIPDPVANPRNTTTFYLRVSDAAGCVSLTEDTVKVIITPPIVAYAGPDTTIVYGQPYQLNATGASIYQWTPAFGLNNPNIANPLATLFADQVYQVEVSTPEGCKGNATVRLKVYKGPEIYVPTGFSPNGDGRNDIFRVVPVGIKKFEYLRIYNRWGQVVFETQNPDLGWTGFYRSQEQSSGTYIYMVRGIADNGRVIFKRGSLLLIR